MNRRNFLTTSIAALLAAPLLATLPKIPPAVTGRIPDLHYRARLTERLRESMTKRWRENGHAGLYNLHLTAEDEEELRDNIVNDDFGGRQLAMQVQTVGLRTAMPKLFGYDVVWDAPEFGLFPKPTPDFF